MRNIVSESIELNSLYREIAKKQEFKIDSLTSIEDLEKIPFITTASFKEGEQLYEKLLKIPVDSPNFQYWNVSSVTSGQPSLVGVDINDTEFLFQIAKKCFLDFIPRDWARAHVHMFSPSDKMLDRIVMRYTKVKPARNFSSNFYKVAKTMATVKYVINFSLPRAIKAILKTRSLVGAFVVRFNSLLETIDKNLSKPEEKRDYIAIGGSCQLIKSFIGIMRQQRKSYNLGTQFDVVIGGGGWDGHKAQLKYDPINKADFVENIVSQFGTKASQIVDIYGFTETPIIFGSHWSKKHEDFIMHCPPYARILIRSLDTLEPFTKEGNRGFLEVITPFGNSASVNHAILVDDLVELVSKEKCSECGYEGATFRVLGRVEDREGLGCSSVITWL
ncbi:MAG: LuxE/PaaK family acyltransferase [Promethearchaeota archaeon]|jgi:phenylacetate-coenzyme A ligase PaaK-like adenylate-forming protein